MDEVRSVIAPGVVIYTDRRWRDELIGMSQSARRSLVSNTLNELAARLAGLATGAKPLRNLEDIPDLAIKP